MKNTIVIISALFLTLFQAHAEIRYVTPNGAGSMDGSSWANAYPGTSLQIAINISSIADEVWVAQGTYYPSSSGNRLHAFNMRNMVAIYGSFTGTETLLSERTISNGLTSILSGEIGAPGISDNSYHVISNLSMNSSSILDGFIVEGANDDRTPDLVVGLGGGIHNNGSGVAGNCSPTIRNCIIRNNQSSFGAGIFNNGYDSGNASPQLINCVIANNHATIGGGGLDNFALQGGNASPTLVNCVVYGNTAAQRAGGMYCWGGNNGIASPVLLYTCFVNNSAVDGGGVVADRLNASTGTSGLSTPQLRNCIFWGNTASGEGPQFFLLGGASLDPAYSDIDLTGQTAPHVLPGTGAGNIELNPLFTNLLSGAGADGKWLTPDDGLQLQSTSPCIDAGAYSGTPLTDILSQDRVNYLNVDMGAYEFDSTVVLSVSEKNPFDRPLLLYPNPTSRLLHVNYRVAESGPVHMTLVDPKGVILWSSVKEQIPGTYELEIDMTPFQNGFYFLNLETNSGKMTRHALKNGDF